MTSRAFGSVPPAVSVSGERLPVGGQLVDRLLGVDGAVGAFQRDRERAGEAVAAAGAERQVVDVALLDSAMPQKPSLATPARPAAGLGDRPP